MGDELTKLTADMEHLKETVDRIDKRLEAMSLSSRLAVLEERQKLLFKMFFGTAGLGGTIVTGIILWLVTGV